MPKEIPLTQDQVAIVDDEDFERLSRHKWTYNNGYAMRKDRNRQWIGIHRAVLNASAEQHVDHINGDTLDNRQENLRLCTARQNVCNSGPRGGTSKFKGVYWFRWKNKWAAQIRCKGEKYHLGYFDSEVEAAKAYDAKALELNGEFAWLNFPNEERAQFNT